MFNAYLPSQTERNWAMLAHGTILSTMVIGFYTGGWGAVAALLLPLGLSVYWRERSPYVAYHALQATVFQALSGIVFVVAGGVVAVTISSAWIITAFLSVILIGLLLIPIAFVVTVIAVLFLLAVPTLTLTYALRGAYLTYQGEEFYYPWVGGLLARSMTTPAASPT